MNKLNKVILLSLFAVLLFSPNAFAASNEKGDKKTIVDVAVENENFSTLVTALKEAGLVEALQGEGPFTVFAPTNDAFNALPEGTLESLLKDKDALKDVLLYHVVSGKVTSKEVVKLSTAETLQGSKVSIRVEDGKVYVDNAQVTTVDIMTSNGVIHVIDSVIVPKK